ASPQRPTISCGGKAGGSAGPPVGAAGCSSVGPVAQPDSPSAKIPIMKTADNEGRFEWLIPAPERGRFTTLECINGQCKRTLGKPVGIWRILALTPGRRGNISRAAIGTPFLRVLKN